MNIYEKSVKRIIQELNASHSGQILMEQSAQDSPEMIGPYKVVKAIGKGGMGEVFLVIDPEKSSLIALKRILPDIQKNEKHKAQFLDAAKLASQLDHPAIVPIYSIVEEPDLIYYTMPFIEGETLQQIINKACKSAMEGRHPENDSSIQSFSNIFKKICETVAYANSKGVIHRDLKPSNVIIGRDGAVHVLDWGLAIPIELAENAENAKTIHLSGTVVYLAPELLFGKPSSTQTEIYSLGLIFYEMLTLRFPFHRGTIEDYIENFQREALIDPAKVDPNRNIPPALSKIALKCLEPSEEERYQNIEDILQDLESWLQESADWEKKAEEQRQTVFHKGLSILEEAKNCNEAVEIQNKIQSSLDEFGKLRNTPEAPLEYLGQALIFQWLDDFQREIQAFEQAFSHYPSHPLLPTLHVCLMRRAFDAEESERHIFYQYALPAIQYAPVSQPGMVGIFVNQIKTKLDPVYFIDSNELSDWDEFVKNKSIAVHLAFLLAKPRYLVDIIDSVMKIDPSPLWIIEQALIGLLELGAWELAQKKIDAIFQQYLDVQAIAHLDWIQEAIRIQRDKHLPIKIEFMAEFPKFLLLQHLRPIFFILGEATRRNETQLIIETVQHIIDHHELPINLILQLDCYLIWALMFEKKWESAGKVLQWYSSEATNVPFFKFLLECWLSVTQAKKINLPRVTKGHFQWEKRQIYQNLALYYHCTENPEKEQRYCRLEAKTWL